MVASLELYCYAMCKVWMKSSRVYPMLIPRTASIPPPPPPHLTTPLLPIH